MVRSVRFLEFRHAPQKLDRVPFPVVGSEIHAQAVIDALSVGSNLDAIIPLAQTLLDRRQVSVEVYADVVFITADYVDASDDELSDLTDGELASVVRERERFLANHPDCEEAPEHLAVVQREVLRREGLSVSR